MTEIPDIRYERSGDVAIADQLVAQQLAPLVAAELQALAGAEVRRTCGVRPARRVCGP